MFDVRAYGAKGDGVTNDLAALQAAANAVDAAGGGTLQLAKGSYFIGTGTWRIGNANAQHLISIVGQGPLVSQILSSASGTTTAVYLNTEKYVKIDGIGIVQGLTTGNGVGLVMGGDGTTGTATNGLVVNNLLVEGFNVCIGTSGSPGIGTSSEITFINLDLQLCTTGFNNSSFNGLDFTFIQLQMSNNTMGINMATAGANVYGGSASNDGTDFSFANGGQNIIVGFRSELPNLFLNFAGSNLLVAGVNVQQMNTFTITASSILTNVLTVTAANTAKAGDQLILRSTAEPFLNGQVVTVLSAGLSTSQFETNFTHANYANGSDTGNASYAIAVNASGNNLTIQDSLIAAEINYSGGSGSNLTLRNNGIIDDLNTYTPSNVVNGMGPGFRIPAAANSGAHWESVNNIQFTGTTFSTGVAGWPANASGYTASPDGSVPRKAIIVGAAGQGATLTISSNSITPTSYVHHVGAGLIKNIAVVDAFSFAWPGTCLQLIPDAAFTTDTTGNIAKASTAVTGQVMTMCYDPVAAKWYPSY